MTKIYNKLVGDKIPDIIEADGKKLKTRILSDQEHLEELINKLKEEAAEFEENPSIEELADIKEITIAIREALGIHAGELEDMRRKKSRQQWTLQTKNIPRKCGGLKKVYVAARAKYRAQDVADIHKKLQEMGYELPYDWPSFNDEVRKPYRYPENRKFNLTVQQKMLIAAAAADIFIFLDDPGLRGAYMELGAFLRDCLDRPKGRKAYIVGPDSHQRQSIFESPEYVIFKDTIGDVYEELQRG